MNITMMTTMMMITMTLMLVMVAAVERSAVAISGCMIFSLITNRCHFYVLLVYSNTEYKLSLCYVYIRTYIQTYRETDKTKIIYHATSQVVNKEIHRSVKTQMHLSPKLHILMTMTF